MPNRRADCVAMPHMLHMSVALTTAALFLLVTALVVVASSDLNPVSSGRLSSPAAMVRLRILLAKALYIIIADCLDSNVRLQCLGMSATVLFILYWNLRQVGAWGVGRMAKSCACAREDEM
jgi:hypothetical protein